MFTPPVRTCRFSAAIFVAALSFCGLNAHSAPRIEVYAPAVTLGSVHNEGADGELPHYNHAPDVVRFKGRFIASWMGNAAAEEGKAGQSLYFSTSDDFRTWARPSLPKNQLGRTPNTSLGNRPL
jgi:hypothetical protein